jgi:hypothetical protein
MARRLLLPFVALAMAAGSSLPEQGTAIGTSMLAVGDLETPEVLLLLLDEQASQPNATGISGASAGSGRGLLQGSARGAAWRGRCATTAHAYFCLNSPLPHKESACSLACLPT